MHARGTRSATGTPGQCNSGSYGPEPSAASADRLFVPRRDGRPPIAEAPTPKPSRTGVGATNEGAYNMSRTARITLSVDPDTIHVDPDGCLVVDTSTVWLAMPMTTEGIRLVADRLLQWLADNDQAMPCEIDDTVKLPEDVRRELADTVKSGAFSMWETRFDRQDAIGARLNGDDGPDAA